MAISCPRSVSCFASSTNCFSAPPKARPLMTYRMRTAGHSIIRVALRPFLAPHFEGDEKPHLLHVDTVVPRAPVPEVAECARDHAGIQNARGTHPLGCQTSVEQRRKLTS